MNRAPAARRYLGLDVGGTKCAALVGDGDGRVLARVEWPSRTERGPGPMLEDLIGQAAVLLRQHPGVTAAGVAIGGPLDAEAGVILGPPNLPGWDHVPLRQVLTDRLGLPVAVEHDGAACALAECWWGAGQGARRLAYLTCGTGFGLGLVVDGRIYRGAGGSPSDIGHIRYRSDGPLAYGKRGSLEAFAAGAALPKLAAWMFPDRWGQAPPAGPEISRLAAAGDAQARDVVDTNARAVGDACACLADLLYPDVILLGSLARYLGEPWLAVVREQFAREAYPRAQQLCRILPAGLGERLQDCSTLAAARSADPAHG